jgi:hypothetical protein
MSPSILPLSPRSFLISNIIFLFSALLRHRFISLEKADLAAMDRENWLKMQKELSELFELHESSVSDPGVCRTFNSRASLFLEKLEDLQAYDIADRVMDLLAGCSPKDFSPCDNRQCTKGSLERLQHRIREKLEKS